jgi:hypothetical protein
MKISTLIAASLFTVASAAAAQEDMTLNIVCWKASEIAGMVEKKQFMVSRYYEAGFKGASGHMAELIDPKDRKILWFAIDSKIACLLAVAAADKDDLKRVGLK